LIIQGAFQQKFGTIGQPYRIPPQLQGGQNLGFMYLPNYRIWVIFVSVTVCLGAWLIIEKTKLGSYLRATTENPMLVRAFGVNVPRMVTLTYGFGVALAGLAGVMAAPINQVNPLMGSNIIIVVFAVVVIGGLGSILGSIVTGFGLGVIEGLTKVFYPQGSSTVLFVFMVIVLLLRPSGLFGRLVTDRHALNASIASVSGEISWPPLARRLLPAAAMGFLLVAPFVFYPVFLMKAMCFALFACALNLLVGYAGLLSFGHAAFLGVAAYVTAHTVKEWGLNPEIGIGLGVLTSTAFGAVFGWLAIRRQGIYFAMVTLALAQLVYFVALQAPFTHGEDGIQAVPRGHLFGVIDLGDMFNMYYFVAILFAASFLLIHRIVKSPFGNILKAIRENPSRAVSLGYDADRHRLLAFTLSAAFAGLAGSLKAIVFQLAALPDLNWSMSGDVILMLLLGGVGTLFGPVVGAVIIVAMQSYLAEFGSWITMIQGGIFVACVMAFRRGVVGELIALAGRGQRTKLGAGRRLPANSPPIDASN
jgi:branched-chain amino acid transport system permease protein